MEDLTFEELAKAVADDTGVDLETAKKAVWAAGEYMWENSDENEEFHIPQEAFDEANES